MKKFLFILSLIASLAGNRLSAQDLANAYVNVSGTMVYVEGGGTGKGTRTILVHAGFQDRTIWDAQAKELMKDHVIIMLDLPGHGKTKDGPEPPMAADVIKVVMDSLQIKKANLVGISLGGAVVTDFAIAHPQRVEKLILVSTALIGWDEGRKLDTTTTQYFSQFNTALTNKDTAGAAEVFTHYWFDGLTRSEKTVSPLLRNLFYTTTKNTLRQHHASGWPKFATPSAITKISDLKVPTLLLTGTLDLPEELLINGYLVNNLPNASQVMISGAAHMINMEKPERFNQEVRKFLDGK